LGGLAINFIGHLYIFYQALFEIYQTVEALYEENKKAHCSEQCAPLLVTG
jgi:hypothetical protein